MDREFPRLIYIWLIPTLWTTWWGYWIFSFRNVQRTTQSESLTSRSIHLLLVCGSFAIIAIPAFRAGPLGRHWLPRTNVIFFFGVAVLVAGLALAAWARHHLGRYWSGTITVKEKHELIQSGPYAVVRHPIYSGFITGMTGTAIALGEFRGMLAVLVLVVAYLRKIRIEEKWLIEYFGRTYLDYRNKVRVLIPFVL